MFMKTLLRIGFVSRDHNGVIVWPFHGPPRWALKSFREFISYCRWVGWKPYLFRNLPHVVKWLPNRMLPRRWGFGWLGFEFGDRGH